MQGLSSVVLQGMVTLALMSFTRCSTAGLCRARLLAMLVPAFAEDLLCVIFQVLFFPSHKKMFQKAGFPCRNTVVPGQLFQLIYSCQPVISSAFLGALHPCDIALKYLRREKSISGTIFAYIIFCPFSVLFGTAIARGRRSCGLCPQGVPSLRALWSSLGYLILCCPDAFISQQLIAQEVYKEKQKEANNWKCTECCCSLVTGTVTAVQPPLLPVCYQLILLSPV